MSQARFFALGLIFVLALATPCVGRTMLRDVCILGAGPSGMSAAAFLKDLGLTSVIVETDDVYGGNCNTEYFNPPAPGLPDWIDIGTAAFENSTFLTLVNGDTFWTIDTVFQANRFSGGNVVSIGAGGGSATPNYAADWLRGITIPIPPPTPESIAEFQAAFGRLFALVEQYPWFQSAERPSPIPAELLVPFSQIVAEYDLYPLLPLFIAAVDGVTNYDTLLATYGLIDVKPSLLYFFTNPNEAGFIINGGCIKMYDGMAEYIGNQNILLGARVKNVLRPNSQSNSPVKLQVIDNSGSIVNAICQNLIVAFPENLDTIRFLDPDTIETAAYQDFSFRYWAALELNTTGPITEDQTYLLYNWNATAPWPFIQNAPSVQDMYRNLPYGPSGSYITSEYYLTPAQARAVWEQQVANIPKEYVTEAKIINLRPHASYGPHAPADVLAREVNPYEIQRQIQGHRKTWWSSTTPGDNDSMVQWNRGNMIAHAIKATGRWTGTSRDF
jgi:hypothetical protein